MSWNWFWWSGTSWFLWRKDDIASEFEWVSEWVSFNKNVRGRREEDRGWRNEGERRMEGGGRKKQFNWAELQLNRIIIQLVYRVVISLEWCYSDRRLDPMRLWFWADFADFSLGSSVLMWLSCQFQLLPLKFISSIFSHYISNLTRRWRNLRGFVCVLFFTFKGHLLFQLCSSVFPK